MDRKARGLGPIVFADCARATRCLTVNKAPKISGPGRSRAACRIDDLLLM